MLSYYMRSSSMNCQTTYLWRKTPGLKNLPSKSECNIIADGLLNGLYYVYVDVSPCLRGMYRFVSYVEEEVMSLLEFNWFFRLLLSLSQFQPIFMSFVAILSHVIVSRRPCWWSRTKAFLSSSGQICADLGPDCSLFVKSTKFSGMTELIMTINMWHGAIANFNF